MACMILRLINVKDDVAGAIFHEYKKITAQLVLTNVFVDQCLVLTVTLTHNVMMTNILIRAVQN